MSPRWSMRTLSHQSGHNNSFIYYTYLRISSLLCLTPTQYHSAVWPGLAWPHSFSLSVSGEGWAMSVFFGWCDMATHECLMVILPHLFERNDPVHGATVSLSLRISNYPLHSHTHKHKFSFILKCSREEMRSVFSIDLRVDFLRLVFPASKRRLQLERGCEWHVMTLTRIPCLITSFEVHSGGFRLPLC